jgi:hypothetical protein
MFRIISENLLYSAAVIVIGLGYAHSMYIFAFATAIG